MKVQNWKGFKSYVAYQEYLAKEKLCKSLQDIIADTKDPESLFTDIEFIREYTGCKIPIKKKERKE